MDEGDDINNYKVILTKYINRMQTAEKVIAELRPKMTAFHGKIGGALAGIEALFSDMAPEPQKVQCVFSSCIPPVLASESPHRGC